MRPLAIAVAAGLLVGLAWLTYAPGDRSAIASCVAQRQGPPGAVAECHEANRK